MEAGQVRCVARPKSRPMVRSPRLRQLQVGLPPRLGSPRYRHHWAALAGPRARSGQPSVTLARAARQLGPRVRTRYILPPNLPASRTGRPPATSGPGAVCGGFNLLLLSSARMGVGVLRAPSLLVMRSGPTRLGRRGVSQCQRQGRACVISTWSFPKRRIGVCWLGHCRAPAASDERYASD